MEPKTKTFSPWIVLLALGFMWIVGQTALSHKPVRFSAWKDSPGHIMVEVYDVLVHFPEVKEDPVGVFVQFPDRSFQYVPVTEKPVWRK